MRTDELDRAFGATPSVFTDRIDDTLLTLKEERPVKRFTIRTAIIAALIALLLCGIAYAIVSMQGQEWYYQNRFTAYQDHEPQKHQAIIEILQTEVPQKDSGDEQGLINVVVQDYAWAAEQNVFTMSTAARVNDDSKYELYSLWELDVDGSWGSELDPDDPEVRTEHWLWTSKGHGKPEDVMLDPSKQLLLVDFGDYRVFIGDTDVEMPGASFDTFIGEDGASICVQEFDLTQLDPKAIHARYDEQLAQSVPSVDKGDYQTLHPGDEGEAVKRMQQRLSDLGYYNGAVNGAYDDETQLCLKAFQDKNDLVNDGVAGILTQTRLFAEDAVPAGDEFEPRQNSGLSEDQIADMRDWALDNAAKMNSAIERSTDAEGNLTLRMDYQVYRFKDGELVEPTAGTATFTVKTR